jgi:hypothetical protein
MTHYHLEGLENTWVLVRETPSSQKFTVETGDGKKLGVDIHYTPSKVLTVSICGVGSPDDFSKVVLTPVMEDIAKLALRRADYGVIDYSMCFTEEISDGNYSVDPQTRKAHQV